MDERLTEEGIEHLQAAARELISAARIFLDVVEDMVDEPDRVVHSLSGAVEMLRDMAGRPEQPWEAHARNADAATARPGNGSGRRRRTDVARGGVNGATGDLRGTDGSHDFVPEASGRSHDEPTLFETDVAEDDEGFPVDDSGARGAATSVSDESDWAVWDEDEPPESSVVDIRRAARRSPGRSRSGSGNVRTARGTGSGAAVKRSSVKRISVD